MWRIGMGLVVGAALTGCASDNCPLSGCGLVATLDLLTTADASSLPGATIDLCIADRCAHATLTTRLPSAPGEDVRVDLAGDLRGLVTLSQISGGTNVTVTVLPSNGFEPTHGDRYTVTMLDDDGGTMVDRAWTALYVTHYPNYDGEGAVCGPACPLAVLTPE
jgi:hypothetical protein